MWKIDVAKYFQQKEVMTEEMEADQTILTKQRKKIGILLPASLIYIIWLPMMAANDYWYAYREKWEMSLVMVFGSMFAGATSEGGAAIAFPALTLIFDEKPAVARDFSFMIQSVGMTAATFTILFMGLKLEQNSLVFSTLGGMAGMFVGLQHIAPELDPPVKKIMFVSIWFGFCAALYLLNRDASRRTYYQIPDMKMWKSGILFLAGTMGGIFGSVAGSGIDICSFAVLTLLFRVNERVATPTSVVLMAINTVFGYMCREMSDLISDDAREYLYVCMPIVCWGAPLGSALASRFHRLTLAALVYTVDTIQLIGAFILVDPKPEHTRTPEKRVLLLIGCAVVLVAWAIFLWLARQGEALLARITDSETLIAGFAESREGVDVSHNPPDLRSMLVYNNKSRQQAIENARIAEEPGFSIEAMVRSRVAAAKKESARS